MKAKQLANVMGVSNKMPLGVSADPFHDGSTDPMIMAGGMHYVSHIPVPPNISSIQANHGNYADRGVSNEMQNLMLGLKKPITYNLQGIKDRLKER